MIHIANLLLAALLLGGSAAAWFGLPDVIPVHFDLAGNPDRWADTTLASWFALPLMAVALAAAMYALARWLPGHPRWVSFPGKERYLELPPRERRPVDEAVQSILHWTGAYVLALFSLVQVLVYRQAAGLESAWLFALILAVSVGGGPLFTAFVLVRIQRALDAAWRRHRATR